MADVIICMNKPTLVLFRGETILNFTFKSFVDGRFDYDKATKTHTGLNLHEEKADISGGKIKFSDIDVLENYPDVDTVTVSGLNQETFEYFILNYGKQLKAIRFFKNKQIEDLSFLGKKIIDNDFSFLSDMLESKEFDFSLNLLTTEQVAWIVANFPHLKGLALKAKHDCELYKHNKDLRLVPATINVGKRKPSLKIKGNEQRIKNYELKFEALAEKYKGKKYSEIF